MADALRMDPGAPMPVPSPLPFHVRLFSFGERAAPPDLAPAAAAPLRARKPLRRPKEPLPVASAVDPAQVRNVGAPGPPAGAAPPGAAAPGVALPPSPPPATVFDGGDDAGITIPPDTMGAVSDRFVFNPLNDDVHIFDRSGASLSRMALDTFWDVFTSPMDAFDPRAVFDPEARRFFFTSTANAERPTSSLLLAVSETDDPNGNWIAGFVAVDPALQGDVWLDFPSIGFAADKVTVQVNLYTLQGNRFAGSSVYVWDKHELSTPPHAATPHLFVLLDQGGTQVPAVTYDAAERTQVLVSRWTGNHQGRGIYTVYEITGDVAAGTVALNRVGDIEIPLTWDSDVAGDFAPQLGSPRRIDAGDDRVLSAVVRDGALWLSNTVFLPAGGPTRCAAQWLQIEIGSWNVLQLGRLDDPTGQEFFAFPTLAVNGAGDALLGCARFAAADFAGGAYALRRAADAPGTLRPPHLYAAGGSSYFKANGGVPNRWGDYSSTQVDPLDDRSFWTVQERAADVPDTWATRWARVL